MLRQLYGRLGEEVGPKGIGEDLAEGGSGDDGQGEHEVFERGGFFLAFGLVGIEGGVSHVGG